MPDWTDTRPEPREFAAIPLVRVPTSGAIAGCITSTQLLSCPTHFAQHRTQPCEGRDCPHCHAGYPARPHAYLSFLSRANGRQYVLELTGLAANTAHDAIQKYGKLRGLLFNAFRAQKRPNGRVQIELAPDPAGDERLPPPVDIPRFMAMLWNLGDPDNPLRQTPTARQSIRNIPRTVNTPALPADKLPAAAGGNGQ
jgi:hypothetical protein